MNRLRRHFLGFLLFALLLVAVDAFAGSKVLPAGREKDVLALFAPYGLGAQVSNEWRLWSVSIEAQKIVVGLREPAGREKRFTLVQPDDAPADAQKSPSFALTYSASEDAAGKQRLRDPSKTVRGLVLAALPFVLYPGYLLRPLNILFIAVYFCRTRQPQKSQPFGIVVFHIHTIVPLRIFPRGPCLCFPALRA